MKVRWTEDSVRLRVTPSELEALQHAELVRVELALPGDRWAATILPGCAESGLTMREGELLFYLSAMDLVCLLEPEAEGVYFQHDGAPSLRYYIEKDFPCAHPRATEAQEPPSETFAAPTGFEERKKPDE